MDSHETPLDAVSLLAWLRGKVGPELLIAAGALQERYPAIDIALFDTSVGSLTTFQGHYVGIEAMFPSGDCVALSVTVAYLTTVPRVEGRVGWNAPIATQVASTVPVGYSSTEWPIAGPEALCAVEDQLGPMLRALEVAVATYPTALET